MQARVTSYSQVERLRERMEKASVRHGQDVRADLPGIRVLASARNWFVSRERQRGEIFFCNMGPIAIREVATAGDDHPLPTNAVVEGLMVPAAGTYDLINALVQSNGDLRVIVDEKTRVVPGTERQVLAGTEIIW